MAGWLTTVESSFSLGPSTQICARGSGEIRQKRQQREKSKRPVLDCWLDGVDAWAANHIMRALRMFLVCMGRVLKIQCFPTCRRS